MLRLTIAKLREFIEADRAESAAAGVAPPKSYWINAERYLSRALRMRRLSGHRQTREGGESGPLIAFLNSVGEDIAEDYPDVLVGTLAYNLTSTPPKHVRPRDNVLVGWCDVYSKVDGIRPLEDPLNAVNYGEITVGGKSRRDWRSATITGPRWASTNISRLLTR